MEIGTKIEDFVLKEALLEDVPLILSFIRELAEYEKLSGDVVATEEALQEAFFGERPYAEVLIGYFDSSPVCFALYFHNFSTFLGKPGIYLEDLYVKPEFRSRGFARLILCYLANLAMERNCGRLEWAVLDWNEPAIEFYKSLGAASMDQWIIKRLSGEALTSLAEEF